MPEREYFNMRLAWPLVLLSIIVEMTVSYPISCLSLREQFGPEIVAQAISNSFELGTQGEPNLACSDLRRCLELVNPFLEEKGELQLVKGLHPFPHYSNIFQSALIDALDMVDASQESVSVILCTLAMIAPLTLVPTSAQRMVYVTMGHASVILGILGVTAQSFSTALVPVVVMVYVSGVDAFVTLVFQEKSVISVIILNFVHN